jgi:hypothetical protein
MMTNNDYWAAYCDAGRSHVLKAVGRELRAHYGLADPLPDRLRDLLIELDRRAASSAGT